MHRLVSSGSEQTIGIRLVDKKGLATFLATAPDSLRTWATTTDFDASFGSVFVYPNPDGQPGGVLAGVQSPPNDPRATFHLFAKLALKLPKSHQYAVTDVGDFELDGTQASIGWGLAGYRFNRYREENGQTLPELVVPDGADMALAEAQLDAIFFARDLVNTPPNDLGPGEICDAARALALDHNAELTVLTGDDLLEAGYPSIHTVGAGSYRPPALVDLRWGDASHPKLTLVGKGVIFDTGGLNLKSTVGMKLMKKDMGGAAMVMALAKLIMTRALPVRLRLLVPTVENSPGRHAYRPSDVIRTRSGLTVEIGNTDAEGRVIMCDALTEAVSEEPDLLIDAATLTGACRIALGPEVPGFWTPEDDLGDELTVAGRQSGDPVWRLPLWQPYRHFLNSNIADMNNNSSSSQGGAIAAALYLYEFVKPFSRWIHLDMNGWNVDNKPGFPKGGEASALRAVFQMLQNRYNG